MQDKNTIDIIILPTNIKKRKPSKKKRKVYKTPHLHTAKKERERVAKAALPVTVNCVKVK